MIQTGQYALGWMYEHGYGVAKSKSNAVSWYLKAASNTNEKIAATARKRLNQLGVTP